MSPGSEDFQIDERTSVGDLGPSAHMKHAQPPLASLNWEVPPTDAVARWLPQFDNVQFIGRGGMGAVYRAVQPQLRRTVAIKLLPEEMSRDTELAERFRREPLHLASFHHPNIVSVFDSGETPAGHLFFVMEHVDGEDLRTLRQRSVLQPCVVLEILQQVCDALGHAHAVGVTHRDVKPGNILVSRNGRVKVVDFGLVRGNADFMERTLLDPLSTNQIVGTPLYAAPEQVIHGRADNRSDIYSLGVVAYELLTGQLPQGAFQAPSRISATDARLDHIILRALQPDPADRYQEITEMRRDLARVQEMILMSELVPTHFEDVWSDLMLNLEERRVVPIVGPDALVVEENGRPALIGRILARRLAATLGVEESALPGDYTINHVAGIFLKRGGAPHRIYTTLHRLAQDPSLPLPDTLLNLASLESFTLFLSTSFLPLLDRAIIAVRGVPAETQVFSRLDKTPTDLPVLLPDRQDRIFHLFGQTCGVEGSFAVTDEDVIEVLQALQGDKRPQRLFDHLQQHHLLLIGTGLPDWPTRLLVRQAKGKPYSLPGPFRELLVDPGVQRDPEMHFFYKHFGCRSIVFPRGDPREFTAELLERWRKRHPAVLGPTGFPPGMEVPAPLVFVSGTPDDAAFTARLADALESAGLSVWHDPLRLAGDIQREDKIQRRIRQALLFLPVISRASEGQIEGWFRREWKWASDRMASLDCGAEFLCPVRLGPVTGAEARIPASFHQSTWLPVSDEQSDLNATVQEIVWRYRRQRKLLKP